MANFDFKDNHFGLVLEGGAMRGLFSAGVMDVLMESEIVFDTVIGVSAGAAFGCNYKSRQPGRALRYNQLMAKDKRYCSFRNVLKEGNLFSAEFCYHYVPNKIDIFDIETFRDNPTKFYVVCTDLLTGEAVYKCIDFVDYDALEWIRASTSMPLVSKPVKLDDYILLDGGIADSIPLRAAEDLGCNKNVVILTQPFGYVKTPNPFNRLMCLYYGKKYPKFSYAINERHIMYNKQLEYVLKRETEGKSVVIRPPYSLPIGHISHDKNEMQRVYDIGQETGKKYLSQVLDFIKNK